MVAETKQIVGSAEIKVLYNHIYEYKKGVRNLILYTLNEQYVSLACERLDKQRIPYLIQRAGKSNINIYFGQPECIETIRSFVSRPLNTLTPEEDFILGALLGYNICEQCKRFCTKKKTACRA